MKSCAMFAIPVVHNTCCFYLSLLSQIYPIEVSPSFFFLKVDIILATYQPSDTEVYFAELVLFIFF